MSLPIISADQRLAEPRGIKGCIFGKSGIGKTSLLWTLDPARTLFMDLEAGDLAIEGWPGDSIRPRTWAECRDFAVFIGAGGLGAIILQGIRTFHDGMLLAGTLMTALLAMAAEQLLKWLEQKAR